MKPVGEPDAGDRHVRFDERGWETERMAQATAPILDSTIATARCTLNYGRFWRTADARRRVVPIGCDAIDPFVTCSDGDCRPVLGHQ